MTTFKVGDTAFLQNMLPEFARLEGEEAIVKRLINKGDRVSIGGHLVYAPRDGYFVDVRSFGVSLVSLDQLRKPSDPAEAEAIAAELFNRLCKPLREAV